MRNEEIIKFQDFSKRSFMIGCGKMALFSIVMTRLSYLQLIKSDEFNTLSENNRIKIVVYPPLRGVISDRFGNALAVNHTHYRAMFERERLVDAEKVAIKLAEIMEFEEEATQALKEKFQQYDGRAPISLFDRLKWRDVSRIEVNSPDLPGVFITEGHQRYYPTGYLYSHVIGYVGPFTEKDKQNKNFTQHPDFRIGKVGIEKTFEEELKGKAGLRKMEVNAHGLNIRELSKEESIAGKEVKLTIDSRLQNFLYKNLPNRGSAAVVLNIVTGEILALVSKPSYDPNSFTQGISYKDWNELTGNPTKPLLNRVISTSYPAGSIFKLIVAIAALKDGIPHQHVSHCAGYIELGSRRFNCWKKTGHGNVNLIEALKFSCNCYTYNLAMKIGIDKIAKTAQQFGFGQILDIEIPGEISGVVPSKEWKMEKLKKSWQLGDTLNSSIGQGYVQVTPLQLAIMTARIASNGKIVKPHLINQMHLRDRNSMRFEQMPISQKHFDIIKQGMEEVVNVPGGTAFGSRIHEMEFRMAGKTGTSQVVSKKNSNEDYSTDSTKWHQRNHGLFVGYAPIDRPKYACAVVIEHGGSGPKAAAPVGKEILLETQKIYQNL